MTRCPHFSILISIRMDFISVTGMECPNPSLIHNSHFKIKFSLLPPWIPAKSSSYPRSPNLCSEAVVDLCGNARIFIQCSCLICPSKSVSRVHTRVSISDLDSL